MNNYMYQDQVRAVRRENNANVNDTGHTVLLIVIVAIIALILLA